MKVCSEEREGCVVPTGVRAGCRTVTVQEFCPLPPTLAPICDVQCIRNGERVPIPNAMISDSSKLDAVLFDASSLLAYMNISSLRHRLQRGGAKIDIFTVVGSIKSLSFHRCAVRALRNAKPFCCGRWWGLAARQWRTRTTSPCPPISAVAVSRQTLEHVFVVTG